MSIAFLERHEGMITAIAAGLATHVALFTMAVFRSSPEQYPKTRAELYVWFRAAGMMYLNLESPRPILPATISPANQSQ